VAKKNQGRTPRTDNDFYPTPWPLPLKICERLKFELGDWVPEVIIEPSAGNGNFVYAAKVVWPSVPVVAVELRAEEEVNLKNRGADLVCIEPLEKFAERYCPPKRALAIGNPPFSKATDHISLLLDFLHPDSWISFLLKLNFESGKDRAENFWSRPECHYDFKIPIVGRPSFKQTDLAENAQDEYAQWNWRVGRPGEGKTHWPHIFWKPSRRDRK
jgi:predicted RNA methylase